MTDQPAPTPIGSPDFWRLKTVIAKVGMSKTEIYRRQKRGDFPRGRKVSPRVTVWPSTEIFDWQLKVLLG